MVKKLPIILLGTILTLLLVAIPVTGAVADAEMPGSYDEYIAYLNSVGIEDGDWYLGEEFLDVYNALVLVKSMLDDDAFNAETLKADPVVIAVIDTGIGHAYKNDFLGKSSVAFSSVYGSNVEYELHEIFNDVLLTNNDGYVYYNAAKKLKTVNNLGIQTEKIIQDTGNIAHDLVDNAPGYHGIHVTGIVASLIHMLDLEEYIKILPIKANSYIDVKNKKTSFEDEVLMDAMNFAHENGADIISMSLSGDMVRILSEITDDVVIVAAAGNSSEKSGEYYPAAYTNVLGVMSYDNKSKISSFSNYGAWYEIAAPGSDVISSIGGETYGSMGGTSMATPVAAFASALAYFRYRGYDALDANQELTAEAVREMIPYCASKNTEGDLVYPMLSLVNILTYNFEDDDYFWWSVENIAEEIEIVTDIKDAYYIGQEETITLEVSTDGYALNDDDQLVWWCEDMAGIRDEIGCGLTMDFVLPNEACTYEIGCVVVDKDGVEYIPCRNTVFLNIKEPRPSSGQCGENVFWEIREGVLIISGEGEMYDYMDELAPWRGSDFNKVIVEEGVTNISACAFSGSHSLTEIELSSTIDFVGEGAFEECHNLKSITVNNPQTAFEGIIACANGGESIITFYGFANSTTERYVVNNGVDFGYAFGDLAFKQSLDFSNKSVSLESTFAINLFVSNDIFDGCTDTYVVLNKYTYYDNIEEVEQSIIYDYEERIADGIKYRAYVYSDIKAYEMSSYITTQIVTTKDGIEYKGKETGYSVKEYAENMLEKYPNNVKLRTLLVDMLNYGAAAQMYWNYNLGLLASDDLTEEQQAWATKEMKAVSNADGTILNKQPEVELVGRSLSLKERVEINFYFDLNEYHSEDVRAVITYIDSKGVQQRITIDGKDFGGKDHKELITLSTLNANEMRTKVEIELYDAHTGESISHSCSYSVEQYVASKLKQNISESLRELLTAMMMFGDSAEAYFG